MSKTIKIKVDGITGFTNPKVTFLENLPDCVSKRCEIVDNTLELVVEDGCTGVCIEGFITDQSDCADCPSIPFKKCLCDQATVLTPCQKCVGGFIEDICTEEEIAAGKICSEDGCNCPADKPFYSEILEKCVVCLDGSTHPTNKCLICRNGEYVDKDCGNGTCDPNTGDCIPDCDDPNATWNPTTKECECKPGYIASADGCIIRPDCLPGDELPPCKECVDGEIVDVICPDPNKICVNDDCVDKPCEGDCTSGVDCPGENCGCGDEQKCVSCDDDPTALGCGENPCTGGCSGPGDCGPGCGCYQGQCIPCSWFPCGTCGDVAGCGCTDGQNCEGDDGDCEDDLEIEIDGCNLVGTLTKKDLCQCEVINSALTVESTSSIFITANSDLPSETEIEVIEDGGFRGLPTEDRTNYYASFKVDIRKGIAQSYGQHLSLPLFTNAIINNELPTSGTVILTKTAVYQSITLENGEVVRTTYDGTPIELAKSIKDKSEVIFKHPSDNIDRGVILGTTSLDDDGFGVKLIGYKVSARIKDLKFESGCVYKDTVVFSSVSRESLSAEGFKGLNKIVSSTSRNPLFTWSRDGIVFRKLYIKPESNGKYIDILYGPQKFTGPGTADGKSGEQVLSTPEGELLSLKDYKLEVDCGCDNLEVEEKIVICDIEFEQDKHFRLDKCNKQILLDELFDVCPINQDLNFFGWGQNHPSQTYYTLTVNGRSVARFVYDNSLNTLVDTLTGIDWSSWEKTFTEEITSASLEMNHDAGCIVEHTFSILLPTPKIELECETDGTVTATVFDTVNPTIDRVIISNPNTQTSEVRFMTGRTVTINNLPKGVRHSFKIIYEGGCEKFFTKTDNCCEKTGSITIQDNIPGVIGSNTTNISYSTIGLAAPKVVTLNGSEVADTGSLSLTSGSYTLSVVDASGCDRSIEFIVPEITDTSTTRFTLNPICTGDQTDLEITGPANTAFTVNLASGGQATGVTDVNGLGTIPGLSTAGTYTLQTLGVNEINTSVVLDVIPTLNVVTVSLAATNVNCTGNTILLDIVGTNSGLVTISAPGSTGDTTVQLDSNGGGQAQLSYASAGTYTINVTGISLNGQCTTTLNDSISVVINNAPSITDIQVECINPNAASSDVLMKVIAQTGLTVTGELEGTTYTFVASSVSNIYEATLPQASGKSIAITATNGSCEDVVNPYVIENCNCPTVNAPSVGNQSVYYTCDSNSVTLSVTPAINTTVKWFSDASLINEIATGNTYSTSVEGTYYAAGFNADGCPSAPVSVSVLNGSYQLSLADLNDICVDENTVITPSFVGNTDGIEFLFRINGSIVQSWGTLSTYSYTPNTEGAKNIEVSTRRYGECLKTVTATANVINCCDTASWNIVLTGDTSQSCEDLAVNVSGGTAPYTYLWTGTGDQGTVVNQSTNVFDHSVLISGELIDLTLTITDDTGCSISQTVSYNKCGCICDDNNDCQNTITTDSGGTNGAGIVFTSDTLASGKSLNFRLFEFGIHDRYLIKFNGTAIVDSTYFGKGDSPNSCYQVNNLPYINIDSSGDVTADIIAAGGIVQAGITIQALVTSSSQVVLSFDYILPADGVITIEHNHVGICEAQGGWRAITRCNV